MIIFVKCTKSVCLVKINEQCCPFPLNAAEWLGARTTGMVQEKKVALKLRLFDFFPQTFSYKWCKSACNAFVGAFRYMQTHTHALFHVTPPPPPVFRHVFRAHHPTRSPLHTYIPLTSPAGSASFLLPSTSPPLSLPASLPPLVFSAGRKSEVGVEVFDGEVLMYCGTKATLPIDNVNRSKARR